MTADLGSPRPLALAAVFALAVATHGLTVRNDFTFDDTIALRTNAVVAARDVPWTAAFTTDFWGVAPGGAGGVGTWRPVAVLLSRALHALGGGAAWPFHLASVLLHGLVTALLALVAGRHTGNARAGLVVGAVFATLAVNTEAVASAVASADLLAAAGLLAAWAAAGPLGSTPGGRQLALTAAATFAAGLCKESALAVPGLLVLAEAVAGASPRRLLRVGLATGAGAFAALALRGVAYGGLAEVVVGAQENPLLGTSPGVRLATGLALFQRAAGLVVAPFELSADYSFDAIAPVRSLAEPEALLGAALLAAVVGTGVVFRRRLPGAAAAAVLFAASFFLVSNVPVLLPTLFAERLLYAPAMGAALGVGVLLERWWAVRGRVALVVLLAVVAAQGSFAVARGADWQDDVALFSRAVETQPRCARAWTNLGAALAERGQHPEALAAFDQALGVQPTYAAAQTRAGVSLVALGRREEAGRRFEEAVRLDPASEPAVYNLAVFLVQAGRARDAAAVVRRVPAAARSPQLRALLEAIERPPGAGSP
jgi:tetratricopeptide (TPR) repeat protein